MPEQNWNERRARKEYVDELLSASKWVPIVLFAIGKEHNRVSVEEYPTKTGPVY